MFGIFKKKTEVQKLENLYKKKMKEGYDLQSIDRSASDQKYVEADQILKKIESLELDIAQKDADIEAVGQKVVEKVTKATGGTLRG